MVEDLQDRDVPLSAHRGRGLVRILLGVLGIALAVTGLSATATIAAVVATVLAPLSATPVSFGSPSGTLEASASATHYVYVPSSEVAAATCSVDGGGAATWTTRRSDLPAHVVDVEYSQVGAVTVEEARTITISCAGVSDVAVMTLGSTGTRLVFGTLLVSALVLLAWGILARVRTRRHGWATTSTRWNSLRSR